METKFRANPYNLNNAFVTNKDIVNIMKFSILMILLLLIYHIIKQLLFTNHTVNYQNMKSMNIQVMDIWNYKKIHTKKMEFLGDAILGSVVCSYIYERSCKIHNQNEGFLTKLKICLVCGENLCELSKNIGFQKHLIISKHIEEKCSGRDNSNILEDVFEAFIGALYLDNDYKVAENFIIKVIEKYVDFTDILLKDNNYKDQISRYFQQNFSVYPTYKTEKLTDDKGFKTIIYKGEEIIIEGSGNSKKKSEQDASKRALIHYNVIT